MSYKLKPHLVVYGTAFLFCVCWTLYAGKELGWDFLNHHLYLPFAWLNGRIDTDYFGAGPQSYQNPLGYFPIYALIHADISDYIVAFALSAVHAAGIFAAWQLASEIWKTDCLEKTYAAIAAAIATSTPVFLQVIGTSSIDAYSAPLVLYALTIILRTNYLNSGRPLLVAGAFLGISFAIKQSNAVFCVAIGFVLLIRVLNARTSWRQCLQLIIGAGATVLITAGPWAWKLWENFRSPIFPMFNNIFESPYAPSQAAIATRFLPQTATAYVEHIVDIALFKKFTYVETFAPDIKPLLAVALIMIGCATIARSIVIRKLSKDRDQPVMNLLSGRDIDLIVFAAVSYLVWMKTSGNGRYAIPLLLVFGILLVRWAYLILKNKWAMLLCVAVLILQTAYFIKDGDLRQNARPWTGRPYLEVDVPTILRTAPFLHLSTGLQTFGSLAPYLKSDGAISNPIGQMSLPLEGHAGEKLRNLLGEWHGRVRIFIPRAYPDKSELEGAKLLYSNILYRLGLDVDWDECVAITIREESRGLSDVTSQGMSVKKSGRTIQSCKAKPATAKAPNNDVSERDAATIFSYIERECPALYGPKPMATEQGVNLWQRFYTNTDATVTVSGPKGVFAQQGRSNVDRSIGTVTGLLQGKTRVSCAPWAMQTPE